VLDDCTDEPGCTELIEVKHEVAAAHRANGDLVTAMTMWEAIAASEQPARQPRTINNIACVLTDMGDFDKARRLFEEVAAIELRQSGGYSAELGSTYINIAKLSEAALRMRDAEHAYKKAIEVLDHSHIDSISACVALADATTGLASLYNAQLRVAEAEHMFCRALTAQRSALAPHHPSILSTLSSLCKLYLSHSDQLGAGGSSPATLISLGQLFHDSGDLEQAGWHLRKALELLQESLPPTHPQLASVVLSLHKLFEDTGEHEQVESLSKRLAVINRYMDA
jgi:tetratricopeptide (TPR) repeat protein